MSSSLVQAYNPEWPAWFETLQRRLEPALVGIRHRVEHVGSTAVPGLVAKPIIDLDIIVAEADFARTRERLEGLGYFHQGDLGIAGREAFDLSDAALKQALPRHHLYVGFVGAAAVDDHRVFRDFLRASPEWAHRLSLHKLGLCQQHDNDLRSYIEGKSALVGEIMKLARANRAETPGEA